MVAIPFPQSSSPGRRDGEGAGRLINAYYDEEAGRPYWRRTPGMTAFATLGGGVVRGMLEVGNDLYVVYNGNAAKISSGGTVTVLGTVSGVDRVTVADGRIIASNVNATGINPLSFTNADARSDKLLMGKVHSNIFYAFGTQTI